jgi:hypothetical protein
MRDDKIRPSAAVEGQDALKEKAMTGIELIAMERERQVSQEGWSAAHDDSHDGAEMLDAAICYSELASALINLGPQAFDSFALPPAAWPWAASWWKPSRDPKVNIKKAGALQAAELDRLLRAERVTVKS